MKTTLRILLGFILLLVLLVSGVVTTLWFKPEWIFTAERVSHYGGKVLVPEKPAESFLRLSFAKPNLKNRTLTLEIAPGCYRVGSTIDFCSESTRLSFSIRLQGNPLIVLTRIEELEVNLLKFNLKEEKTAQPKPSAPTTPLDLAKWLRYVSSDFSWGNLHLQAKEVRIAGSDLVIQADLSNPVPTQIKFGAKATGKSESFDAWGSLQHRPGQIVIPEASVVYLKRAPDSPPLKVIAEISGSHTFKTSKTEVRFSAVARDPVESITSIRAEEGVFEMSPNGIHANARFTLQPRVSTPLGSLPLVHFDFRIDRANTAASDPIDLKLAIDSYKFADLTTHSNLEMRYFPEEPRFEWRAGDINIATHDFGKLVKRLERTAWSVPAPLNVLRGPISLKSGAIHSAATPVQSIVFPFTLITDLKSTEQAFQSKTELTLALAARDLSPVSLDVAVLLQQLKIRLPDYDPIAPTPAVARDSRIVRPDPPKKSASKEKPEEKVQAVPFRMAIDVKTDPGAIVLLNRFFKPYFAANLNFHGVLDSGVFTPSAEFSTSQPVTIAYIGREVTLQRLKVSASPEVNFSALLTMNRGGYEIRAEFSQLNEKTRIELSSSPPLSNEEIVSLIIYGMPRNSISSEQSRSVGSAQAAMGSEALGIFSFWAFASTPIETVLYDPATETYSAVIRLPGGVVGSIGNNWENEKQVSLSKSLGRNWAVSTEIIRDGDGVNRGGTLLRWRKSY